MHFNRNKVSQLKISSNGKKHSIKNKIDKNVIHPVLKSKNSKKGKIRDHRETMHKGIQQKNDSKNISEWVNILHGHTAFILGNAPSLENQDLSLLDEYFTIGMNRIFYVYDPTILIWQDKQIWDENKKKIFEKQSIKVSSYSGDPKHYFSNFKVMGGPFKFTNNPGILYGRGNTGVLAIQLAVCLGCSNIVLLGTDCKYGANKKTDFYGNNKDHKKYTLKMCRGAMEWVKKNCPVPIYNCSENDLWEKEKLIDVINKIQPPKIGRQKYKEIFRK